MATTKEDRSYKSLQNHEVTDSINKLIFNEFGADTINSYIGDIWSDTIPTNDPSQAVTNGVAELRTLFVLTEDNSVPDAQSWKTEDPVGTRIPDWISPKYGDNFEVKLYDNDDNQIFTTDPVDWFFDYQTGILTFSGTATSKTRPFKITGYRYIGLKDVVTKNYANTHALVLTKTIENFTVAMDSISGNDPTDGLVIYDQSSSDGWGAFKTIPAAVAACPRLLNHLISIQIPDGPWLLDAGGLGDFTRFTTALIPIGESVIDFGIRIESLNGWAQAAGAPASMAVSSSDGDGIVTLQGDPGLGDDTYVGFYFLVMSGTGVDQYKPIRAHSGTAFAVVTHFDPILDSTSVGRIVNPAAALDIPPGDWGILDMVAITGNLSGAGSWPSGPPLHLSRIDLTGSHYGWINLFDMALRVDRGARILNGAIYVNSGILLLADAVVDARGNWGGYPAVQSWGGKIHLGVTGNEALLMIGLSAGNQAAIDVWSRGVAPNSLVPITTINITPAVFFLDWALAYVRFNGSGIINISTFPNTWPAGSPDPLYAIWLRNLASCVADKDGLDTSQFRGSVFDIRMGDDTVGADWSDMYEDPDETILGPRSTVLVRGGHS